MTVIQYNELLEWYRVWENGHVKYLTLEEVLYLLSKKEGEVKLDELFSSR